MSNLLLASSSPYRRMLLERLNVPFDQASPDVDETPILEEDPAQYVMRMAQTKAVELVHDWPAHWVLASDQCASLNGEIIGKPGSLDAAREQLRRASGNQVIFHTAVVLMQHGRGEEWLDQTTVSFRQLEQGEIERYLNAERPFDCAGSFKSEGLGITLFKSIESSDPTALIGLPLIAVASMLRHVGFEVP